MIKPNSKSLEAFSGGIFFQCNYMAALHHSAHHCVGHEVRVYRCLATPMAGLDPLQGHARERAWLSITADATDQRAYAERYGSAGAHPRAIFAKPRQLRSSSHDDHGAQLSRPRHWRAPGWTADTTTESGQFVPVDIRSRRTAPTVWVSLPAG
jgi:hypothetical protein